MTSQIVTLEDGKRYHVLYRLPRNIRKGDLIQLTDWTRGLHPYETHATVNTVDYWRQGRPDVYGRYDQSLTQITWDRSSVSWPFTTWGYSPITYRGQDNHTKVEVYRAV